LTYKDKVLAALKENPGMSNREIAELVGCGKTMVQIYRTGAGLVREHVKREPRPIDVQVKEDRELARLRDAQRQTEARYRHVLGELDTTQSQLNAALAISDNFNPVKIKPEKADDSEEATAIAVISDWHFGSIVKKNTVNGLNEVTPEITWERSQRYFKNLLKLINKERREIHIPRLLLGLIGDLIENSIHDELLEDSVLSPIQEMMMAQDAIASGLDFLLAKSDLAEIVVPTVPGNHGRTTEKMRIQTSYKNSFEQLLYWSLAKRYKDNPRVSFHVSDSYFNYTEVYRFRIRWHHGEAIRYQGGIGSVLIPARKFIHRANQQQFADMSINGHHHSQFIDDDIMMNGSLVGPTAYGLKLGFRPERPQQIFRLLDKKRGFTGYFPILVTE
jgi:hypothetical protein